MRLFYLVCVGFVMAGASGAGAQLADPFRQLDDRWATPNTYRTASGAPGHAYWQQRADYLVSASLDEKTHTLSGKETITYTNNSPNALTYLWLQLDQNRFQKTSKSALGKTTDSDDDRITFMQARRELDGDFGGGFDIRSVTQNGGQALPHTIVDSMMRVDLPAPLEPGQKFTFNVEWGFQIPDASMIDSRGGYEIAERKGNAIYTIAQWYPRMAAYTDTEGWNVKPFLGDAEFALEFGDFEVELTVPADHIVSATGTLQNADTVLTDAQRERLDKARDADKPVFIVTAREALDNEDEGTDETKTWVFKADNVRDFAFASSRKFIWDAMGVKQEDGDPVLAMSFYPNEANPLWSQYSTHAVAHSLEVFSRLVFAYPYPVAQSVNGPIYGMEYPMIAFNGPRPERDEKGKKVYSRKLKYDLLSVIFHEIGHNYFPMIVNSNERRWGWMDEGLNTYLEFAAEQAWEKDYPSTRGEPTTMIDYMSEGGDRPIMTQPDAILELGNNAYGKVAAGLVILRETVLGRELFDFAFKEYARRWKFKRATPEDFFRTMEDASGVDLDWFWRGWFYGTDPVDIGITSVTRFAIDDPNPDAKAKKSKEEKKDEPLTLTQSRDEGVSYRVDRFPELQDFYNEKDEFTVTDKDRNEYDEFLTELEPWQKDLLERGENFYRVDLVNYGGMVMPVRLKVDYADNTTDEYLLPAEIWRSNPEQASRFVVTKKPIIQFTIDPYKEIADIDTSDNQFPREAEKSDLELYKYDPDDGRNLMKDIEVERQEPEKE